MERKEMLKLLEQTFENSCGVDPITGEKLYPSMEYFAHNALETVEKAGMKPPSIITGLKHENDTVGAIIENKWGSNMEIEDEK